MCELNYKGIKIEIGVKLGDQKCNFTYKKWNIYRKSLRCWHVVLTRDSEVNSQPPNRTSGTNFVKIYKIEGPNL